MVRVLMITSFCLSMVAGAVFGAASPLNGTIEARKVLRQDSGREMFVPASEAVPNDLIEYRLTYANTGEAAVRNVSVTDPIPVGTEYVSLSATRPSTGSVEFSIDGGRSYHAWPVRYQAQLENGEMEWRDATPDMVTHIRWTISEEFAPETAITLSYRAIVK